MVSFADSDALGGLFDGEKQCVDARSGTKEDIGVDAEDLFVLHGIETAEPGVFEDGIGSFGSADDHVGIPFDQVFDVDGHEAVASGGVDD